MLSFGHRRAGPVIQFPKNRFTVFARKSFGLDNALQSPLVLREPVTQFRRHHFKVRVPACLSTSARSPRCLRCGGLWRCGPSRRCDFRGAVARCRYTEPSDHGFQYVGPQCRKLLGRSAAKLIKYPSAFAPVIEDATAFQADFIRPMSQGRRAKFEGRFAVGRGRVKWLSVTVEPLDKAKGVFRFAGKVSDIDDTKRVEIEFEMMRERMSRAQEIAEFGWYDYNAKDQVIDFTPEFAQNLGLLVVASGRLTGPLAEKYVVAFRASVHPDDRERFLSIVTDMSWARTEFDFRVVKAGGEVRNMFIRIHRTSDRDGRRLRDFGVILDITERKRLEENLRALAATDALTGVPNRRTFDSVGRREMERARRYANRSRSLLSTSTISRRSTTQIGRAHV